MKSLIIQDWKTSYGTGRYSVRDEDGFVVNTNAPDEIIAAVKVWILAESNKTEKIDMVDLAKKVCGMEQE